jgi:8-oxo-dGTP diphosphatase
MMSKVKPAGFTKQLDIVGCFIQHKEKFLLLLRHPEDDLGNIWGLPAGKKEQEETTKEAVLREVQEETGITLAEQEVFYFDSQYIQNERVDMEWHMFYAGVNTIPVITLNPNEHADFRWVSISEALNLPLVHDTPESIKMFFKK